MDETPTASPSLWRHSAFMTFWVGQSVSMLGTELTGLALPLTAVLILKATPAEMGVLNALQTLPFLLVSLFVGVWADRLRRRSILMGADIGRALLLGAIPLALVLGVLSLPLMFVLTFAFGVLTVFFDVTYNSYIPLLVGRTQVIEANSKLETSRSVARIVGPGLAGVIVQLLTAPVALLFDAVSFVVSGISLALVHTDEALPPKPEGRRPIGPEIAEGLRVVFGNRLLWTIAAATGMSNFFGAVCGALTVLYLSEELKVSPELMGVIFAAGAPGALIGVLLTRRITQRFGLGPTIIGSMLGIVVGDLLMPLASGSPLVIAAFFIASVALVGFSGVIYGVNTASLRQLVTPNRLLGRMNASMRFFTWGSIPLGSLVGGALGEAIGLRSTLYVGAVCGLFAVLWLLVSPIRTLRDLPPAAE